MKYMKSLFALLVGLMTMTATARAAAIDDQARSFLLNVILNGADATLTNGWSNISNLRFSIAIPSITQSNLLISGATNTIKCRGLTNIVATNIVEEGVGIASETTLIIENTLGVSLPIVLPGIGAQHGYYWFTNGLPSDATTAPPGTNTVIAFRLVETNVYPRITRWARP